ncbi:MAG: glycosyltransferase family 4 protein [Mucilaginibacter sp.]
MKILFVFEQIETSRYYAALFYWLVNIKHVDIYVYNISNDREFKHQIGPIIGSANYFQLPAGIKYINSITEIPKCIDLIKPDIIHANMFHCAFYTTIALWYSGSSIPLIYHKHSIEAKTLTEKFMESIIVKKAQKIIFVSNAAFNYGCLKWRKSEEKFVVILNGITINDSDKNTGTDLPDKYILLLGRLRPEKGHLIAIEAFKNVLEKFPTAKLVFAGEGPQRAVLINKIKSEHLEDAILLTGHIENVAQLIKNSLFMIVPSENEPFGLVAIEGLALKKLVIASKTGGLQEIIENEKSGVLLDSKQPADWSNVINYYLSNPQKANALAIAGYEHYSHHFTNEIMAKKYFNLYQEVLNECRKS